MLTITVNNSKRLGKPNLRIRIQSPIAIRLGKFLKAISGSTDGETLRVQQVPDAADHQHFMVLVIAPVPPTLHRSQLGELLLPISKHMRLDAAQIGHFANCEVAFCRNWKERFLHKNQDASN